MIKEKIDYEFFKMIPLTEVAELLGLKKEHNGNYKSPLHLDRHPSMTIETNENHKYYNKWRDWSFNEGGGPIELVMAVKNGIAPSDYWSHREQYKEEYRDAIKFLDGYFPGGIIKLEDTVKNLKEPPIPKIPKDMLQKIGLKNNPFYPVNRIIYNEMGERITTTFQLPKSDAATMIIAKLMDYKNSLRSFIEKVYDYAPELRQIDLAPQCLELRTKYYEETVDKLIDTLREYYLEQVDIDYPSPDNIFGEVNNMLSDIHLSNSEIKTIYEGNSGNIETLEEEIDVSNPSKKDCLLVDTSLEVSTLDEEYEKD